MLTKQEREATIERIKSYGDSDLPFYKLLFGSRAPYAMQYTEYLKALKDRVIDLCDTSNMIELPLDKDGEVIRAGDTVYDKDGDVAEVGGYYYNNGTCKIIIPYGQNGCYINVLPNELTHKKPVTIASLVGEIRRTLSQNTIMNKETTAKLWEITDQIEMLGDSYDD